MAGFYNKLDHSCMPYECLLSDSSASFGALYLIASYLCRVQAFAFEFLVYISVRIASSSDSLNRVILVFVVCAMGNVFC